MYTLKRCWFAWTVPHCVSLSISPSLLFLSRSPSPSWQHSTLPLQTEYRSSTLNPIWHLAKPSSAQTFADSWSVMHSGLIDGEAQWWAFNHLRSSNQQWSWLIIIVGYMETNTSYFWTCCSLHPLNNHPGGNSSFVSNIYFWLYSSVPVTILFLSFKDPTHLFHWIMAPQHPLGLSFTCSFALGNSSFSTTIPKEFLPSSYPGLPKEDNNSD